MIKVWQAGFLIVATVAICGLFAALPAVVIGTLFRWLLPAVGFATAEDGELIGAIVGEAVGLPYLVGMTSPFLLMQLTTHMRGQNSN